MTSPYSPSEKTGFVRVSDLCGHSPSKAGKADVVSD